jgi:hypothetical protein
MWHNKRMTQIRSLLSSSFARQHCRHTLPGAWPVALASLAAILSSRYLLSPRDRDRELLNTSSRASRWILRMPYRLEACNLRSIMARKASCSSRRAGHARPWSPCKPRVSPAPPQACHCRDCLRSGLLEWLLGRLLSIVLHNHPIFTPSLIATLYTNITRIALRK